MSEVQTVKSFDAAELAKFDGVDGNPAYVAYDGKVYDITDAPSWIDGAHYMHMAGEDMTESMQDAPHAEEVMESYPVVGEYIS